MSASGLGHHRVRGRLCLASSNSISPFDRHANATPRAVVIGGSCAELAKRGVEGDIALVATLVCPARAAQLPPVGRALQEFEALSVRRAPPNLASSGLTAGHPTDPKFELPGELMVVSTSGGEPTVLTECGRSWPLYWYDDRHIVLGGEGAVYWVGIDRELRVIADNARLVRQRRRGIRQ